MTKTLDQLAASTDIADADLLLKRDSASGDDKKIREDELQASRTAVRQINVGGAADYTLTTGDSGRPLIELIGALTDNINVIVPNTAREYTFINSTSGSFTITAKTSLGTGVDLPQGELRKVRSDGTNVVTGEGFANFPLMPQVGGSSIEGQVGIGVNQTWQDVGALRSDATTYTNNTGAPIMVLAVISYDQAGTGASVIVDGTTMQVCGGGSTGLYPISFIVPPGSSYLVDAQSDTTTNSIFSWHEMKY